MKHSNFDEVIRFAIRKESDAATLYESMAANAKRENIRDLFSSLAAEEKKHQKLLEDLDVKELEKSAGESIPDMKISDYLVNVEYSPDMNYQDSLIYAMKREEQSLRLYTDLANGAEAPELKKLFQFLSQEERKHKLHLETEYDEHVMTWD